VIVEMPLSSESATAELCSSVSSSQE
jgi:hypothetical protein